MQLPVGMQSSFSVLVLYIIDIAGFSFTCTDTGDHNTDVAFPPSIGGYSVSLIEVSGFVIVLSECCILPKYVPRVEETTRLA